MPSKGWCQGMRRGGTIWWEDGREYVDLLKKDGPCVMIGLRPEGTTAKPTEAARRLFAAFASDVMGLDEVDMEVVPAKIDVFWEDLAAVLKTMRVKSRG